MPESTGGCRLQDDCAKVAGLMPERGHLAQGELSDGACAVCWDTEDRVVPAPAPFTPTSAELVALAQGVMQAARFPQLATIDGDQPRVRPVSPVRVEGFTVYVANLRRYGKTREIARNANVELCYLDERHDQVRITGRAEVLADRALLAEIWAANPLLRKYLGTPDNPDLIIYRIHPKRVRFMREWALDYHEVPLRV